MFKVQLLASSILIFTLAIASGCSDDGGAHFESLGAEVDRNEHGQVVAIRTHGGTEITDADLTALVDLMSLETLDLTETQNTDGGLVHLPRLPNLRELRLQNCRGLMDEGLSHLEELDNLNVLVLSLNPQITDPAVQHLSSIPNLEDLVLVGCGVTDDGLRQLSALTSLRILNLRQTFVTDEGLTQLKELPALTELYLEPGVFITDEGRFIGVKVGEAIPTESRRLITDAGLIHLYDCKQLERLEIGGIHSVTQDGIMSLKQALPECEVVVSGHGSDGP